MSRVPVPGGDQPFLGRRVLVTGGSQGIGRACVDAFARAGAQVLGTWSRDQAAAERAEEELRQAGLDARLVRADLGDASALAALWDTHAGAGFDVLILNAAFQRKARFEETDLALLEQTFRVNVLGNFELARLFIAERRASRRPGSIVVHSSNQGDFVNPTGFAYALSKAALNHMVRHLARATVRDGIRVNGVLLGWFDTEGEHRFYGAEQVREQARTAVPLGRVGEPEEAAQLALYLAHEASAYMTGSLVRFDGGFALAPDLST